MKESSTNVLVNAIIAWAEENNGTLEKIVIDGEEHDIDYALDHFAHRTVKMTKTTPVRLKCCYESHNSWLTTYTNLFRKHKRRDPSRKGAWCIRCSRKQGVMKQWCVRSEKQKEKNQAEYMEKIGKILTEKNAILISYRKKKVGPKIESIYSCTHHVEYVCARNHHNIQLVSNMLHGRYCRKCCFVDALSNVTLCDMNDFVKERGGVCLSDRFIGIMHKYEWKCSQDHTWKARWKSIKEGTWCPKCKTSHFETAVRVIFEELFHGHKFPSNSTLFKYKKSGKHAQIDGFSSELGLAFEADGSQHWHNIKFYDRSDARFELQLEKDKIKDEFFEQHLDFHLIRVKYDRDVGKLRKTIREQILDLKKQHMLNHINLIPIEHEMPLENLEHHIATRRAKIPIEKELKYRKFVDKRLQEKGWKLQNPDIRISTTYTKFNVLCEKNHVMELTKHKLDYAPWERRCPDCKK